MKRLLALIAMLLLWTSTAGAAFDYTPYQLSGNLHTFFPLVQRDDEVLTISNDKPRTLMWWKNGMLLRCAEDDGKAGRIRGFCPMDDGSAIAIFTSAAETSNIQLELTLRRWDAQGLGEPVQLAGRYSDFRQLRNGLALTRQAENGCMLELMDLTAGMQITMVPLTQHVAKINRAVRDGDVWWTTVGCGGSYLLLHTANGATNTLEIGDQVNGLCPDGQEGVFVWTQPMQGNEFSPITLRRLDGELNELTRHTLSAKKLILYLDAVQYDVAADEYRLYGSAVAVSRGLYDVFCITCDAQWKHRWIDVRSFDCGGDWGYHVAIGPGGSAVALGNMRGGEGGAPTVAVPFSDLPKAKDPGIKLD